MCNEFQGLYCVSNNRCQCNSISMYWSVNDNSCGIYVKLFNYLNIYIKRF